MSEQDFFFDDEPQTPNPATKPPKAPKAATSTVKSAASKPAPSKSAASKKTAAVADEPAESFVDQPTTWAIATLVGVCGLLLGLILGFLLGTTLARNAAVATTATPVVTAPAAVSGGGSTLTSAQISAGQLPAGHPAITVPTTATK